MTLSKYTLTLATHAICLV